MQCEGESELDGVLRDEHFVAGMHDDSMVGQRTWRVSQVGMFNDHRGLDSAVFDAMGARVGTPGAPTRKGSGGLTKRASPVPREVVPIKGKTLLLFLVANARLFGFALR